MDKEAVQALLNGGAEMFTKIAEAMKQPAEHIYTIFVRQQMVNGITGIIGWLLYPLGIAMFIRWYYQWTKDVSDSEGVIVTGVFLSTIFALILFGCLVGLAESVGQVINPEFYAIKQIIETVQGN